MQDSPAKGSQITVAVLPRVIYCRTVFERLTDTVSNSDWSSISPGHDTAMLFADVCGVDEVFIEPLKDRSVLWLWTQGYCTQPHQTHSAAEVSIAVVG